MKSKIKQTEALLRYQEELKNYKEQVQGILDEIAGIESEIKASRDEFNSYRRLSIGFLYLDLVEMYCRENDLSVNLLKKVNDDMLNDGRKYFIKSLQEFEEVFTRWVDPDHEDLKTRLATVDRFFPPRQMALYHRFINRLERLKKAYGEQTKWKWAFIEMEARAAVILKNSLNLGDAFKNDPYMPFYEERSTLTKNIQVMLKQASEQYNYKYQVATKEVEDMRQAMSLLDGLRRINILLGNAKEAENCKKKMESWKFNLEKDLKNKDKHRTTKGIPK